MSVADIMHLVGVGFGALMVIVGAALYAVETKRGSESSCLPVVAMIGGVVVALSCLPGW
jgi:hypothetical protein